MKTTKRVLLLLLGASLLPMVGCSTKKLWKLEEINNATGGPSSHDCVWVEGVESSQTRLLGIPIAQNTTPIQDRLYYCCSSPDGGQPVCDRATWSSTPDARKVRSSTNPAARVAAATSTAQQVRGVAQSTVDRSKEAIESRETGSEEEGVGGRTRADYSHDDSPAVGWGSTFSARETEETPPLEEPEEEVLDRCPTDVHFRDIPVVASPSFSLSKSAERAFWKNGCQFKLVVDGAGSVVTGSAVKRKCAEAVAAEIQGHLSSYRFQPYECEGKTATVSFVYAFPELSPASP